MLSVLSNPTGRRITTRSSAIPARTSSSSAWGSLPLATACITACRCGAGMQHAICNDDTKLAMASSLCSLSCCRMRPARISPGCLHSLVRSTRATAFRAAPCYALLHLLTFGIHGNPPLESLLKCRRLAWTLAWRAAGPLSSRLWARASHGWGHTSTVLPPRCVSGTCRGAAAHATLQCLLAACGSLRFCTRLLRSLCHNAWLPSRGSGRRRFADTRRFAVTTC